MKRVLFIIIAVLIVAAAGVYAIYARDLAGARARLIGRSNTVETTLRTAWRRTTQLSSPPISTAVYL
jgi:uncharacterized protein YxeA